MNSKDARSKWWKIGLFLAAQVALLGTAAGVAAFRGRQIEARRDLPPLREAPREVRPLFDEPVVVTDEQLEAALLKLRPKLYGRETVIGHVDHNLRFWGEEAKFHDPRYVDGEAMRAILTDQGAFAKLYGPEAEPLLIDQPGGGVRIRSLEGTRSSSHVDHTTASLAEIGTPLDFPIITPSRRATFRDVVEQAIRDFSLNQVEYEWSAMTFAMFLESDRFVSGEGQEITFDMLADRIMRQRMPQGVCMGNHRLHALAMLLRVDDQRRAENKPFLTPEGRERIESYLEQQTVLLVQHQHEDGFWNQDWPSGKPATRQPTDVEGDRLGDRLIATGHALEWWSLTPEQPAGSRHQLLPPRHVLASAGQWLVRTIDNLSDDDVRQYQSFLSHVGRALALWRGKLPHEVELSAGAE